MVLLPLKYLFFSHNPKVAEKYCTIIVLEMLPLIDRNLKTIFKTLPEIYNHRTFGAKSLVHIWVLL